MKINLKYLLCSKNVFLLLLFVVLSTQFISGIGTQASVGETNLFKNEKLYFSLQLPAVWKTTEVSDTSSYLKLFSSSPDERESISVFVIESKESISLLKLADADTKLFDNLGQLVNTKTKNDYLVSLKQIEKSYKSKDRNTKLLFQVDDNLGYILKWQSLGTNDETYNSVKSTFEVNVPFTKTIFGWFTGIGTWIISIIGIILGIGALYLIGKTGQEVRRGFEIKKALNKAKADASKKGYMVTDKWHSLNKKSTYSIVLPILGWCIFYFILFISISTTNFLISLLALVPVILGYFGILFGASEDFDDYI